MLTPPPAHRLIAASFLVDFCLAMVGVAVQYAGVHVLAAPPLVLGLFGTLSAVAYTAACLVSGSFSDRLGRRFIALIGCAACGAVCLALPLAGHWSWVLGLMFLWGGSMALFWPPIQAWLAEVSPDDGSGLGRNIGIFNIAWTAGLMLGPLAASYLWDEARPHLSFLVGAGLFLPIIGLLLFTPPGRSHAPVAPLDQEPATAEHGDHFLHLARIGNFASFFAMGTAMTLFPKLGHELVFSVKMVGWMLFALRLGQILMFAWLSWEHRWKNRLWPMLGAQILAGLGLAVALIGTPAAVTIGFAATGAGAGITYVASLTYSLHGRTSDRGHTSGLHEAVIGSGLFLGPLVGGISAQWLDLRAPFIIAAMLFGVACVVQMAMHRKARRH